MKKNINPIILAILAAALYGISSPISKLLLVKIPPTFMAALLYIGAGIGALIISSINSFENKIQIEAKLTKQEIPYVIGMVLLDIIAPVCLMIGLTKAAPSNVSLLNNFEIVATAIIALIIFKEAIGKRMWIAISLITIASVILSFEDLSSFSFSIGSIFVILACTCWGFENNCTRMMSLKDPLKIVVIKGFGSGIGSLIIALALRQYSNETTYILMALLLGSVSYGLGIYLYIMAQRELGAARTSAYYAVAPFIGVLLSIVIFGQNITAAFVIALAIMISGAYFAAVEKHTHIHIHDETEHEHRHNHSDNHHTHTHNYKVDGEHSHVHTHAKIEHEHKHTPDLHHTHSH